MISRGVDVGFVVCAGITGAWSLIDREKFYTFLLFLGVVFYVHSRTRAHPHHEDDPSEAITRISALMYAKGLEDGLARSHEQGKDGRHLPRVG